MFLKRVFNYVKKNGIKSFFPRVKRYMAEKNFVKNYYKKTALTSNDIKMQKNTVFSYQPLVSIIIPLYNTPVNFFYELVDTIVNQTYTNWELCLADGTAKETEITMLCNDLMKKDKRIKYKLLESNGGISDNTNEALAMATGEFVMLTDHDDLLELDALYECVKAINEDMTIDSLYTDEDKVDLSGKNKTEPHLKPDFNIEYLRTNNYICHIFVTRREIALKVGGFCKEYDGAQDFDFILKCTEQSRKVHHVPRVLYHWRCHINSTAAKPESKLYAYEAGVKAIKQHYSRVGIEAEVKMQEKNFGYYVAKRTVNEDALNNVSVICENDVKKLNEKIKDSSKDYILILNSEIKYEKGMEKKLLEYATDKEVAAVTCKIIDKDNKVIQGPIMLGIDGLYAYSMKGQDVSEPGYFRRGVEPQNVSVADFRCVMIKKSLVAMQGGLDENLPLGLAIFDYNLKNEELGYRTVFDPYVVVTYCGEECEPSYETADVNAFMKKWQSRVEKGDPYYNENFKINKYMFC